MSTILITGVNGFIGSWVCRTLLQKHPEGKIVGVGRTPGWGGVMPSSNFQYISCDLISPEAYNKLPTSVDILIHLAGDRRTFVPHKDFASQFMENSYMTSMIAEYAAKVGTQLFIYASSVYIYSGCNAPFKEHKLELPEEMLGASKLAAEALLKSWALAGQFNVLATRIFTVYGPGSNREQFIPQAIDKLSSEKNPIRFGAGEIQRDFIYVKDVANALSQAVKLVNLDIGFEAVNIGSGKGIRIKDVVETLASLLAVNKDVSYDLLSPKLSGDTDHVADIQKAALLLNWTPQYSLEQGLKDMLETFYKDFDYAKHR